MKRLVGLLLLCAVLGGLFGCIGLENINPALDRDTNGGWNAIPNPGSIANTILCRIPVISGFLPGC